MQTYTTLALSLSALVACGDPEPAGDSATTTTTDSPTPTTTPTQYNPCGEITYHDLTFRGVVNGVGGQPQVGATVELRDFTFQPPTVLGSSTSIAGGAFEFGVTNLKSIENCWANGRLDYRIVAEFEDASDEERINNPIFNAIFVDKDLVVDLSAVPLSLQ